MDDMLDQLEAIIRHRQRHPTAGSYTSRLFADGREAIAQKVGEEAVEVVIAALCQDRDAQLNELADLVYHTLVLMAELSLSLEDLRGKLRQRHQQPR